MMRVLNRHWLLNRLFNKYTGWTLLCFIALGCVALAVNIVGIRMIGDIDRWTQWVKEKAAFFLLWRLCLYMAVAYGWWWMRERVIQRASQRVISPASQQVVPQASPQVVSQASPQSIQREGPASPENPKEDERQAKARFIRIEVATVCVLLLLEWCHGFV